MPNFDNTGPEGKGTGNGRRGDCQVVEEMISNGTNDFLNRGGRSFRSRSGTGRRCRRMKGYSGNQRGQRFLR